MKKYLFLSITLSLFLSKSVFCQDEKAYPLKSSLWHSTVISVCWDNPTNENKVMRDSVRSAIKQTWEKYSPIRFTDWCSSTQKNCDIHIFINDEGPHTIGLGNQIKNKQHGMVLNFTFDNWSQACKTDKIFCIKAIAVHEFGHALGFAHEQNRDDCNFPNCLGKEQGRDGDWYISPCDPYSVMNYCNPRYNNNGQLSKLDIQALQYLYGSPDNLTASLDTSIYSIYDDNKEISGKKDDYQIVYTTQTLKKKILSKTTWHEFKIYIAAETENSDKIDTVIYHLHPTFKNPNMTITSKEDNYGIGLKVWGEFEISADIILKNREKIFVKKYLAFDKTEETKTENVK